MGLFWDFFELLGILGGGGFFCGGIFFRHFWGIFWTVWGNFSLCYMKMFVRGSSEGRAFMLINFEIKS